MNVLVLNYAGNVGKSVVAKHCLLPRMDSPRFIEIESVNLAPQVDEKILITLRGEQTSLLSKQLILHRNNLVDGGASNMESLVKGFAQYEGSQRDIDLFIIPVTPGAKELADTGAMVKTLSALGVEPERIRLVLNKVSDPEAEIGGVIRFVQKEKLCTLDLKAHIRKSDIYDHLTRKKLTIEEALADTTDYQTLAREANDEGDEALCNQYLQRVFIQRLAPDAKDNLDDVYAALTA